MEDTKVLNDLAGNMRNLEISLLALSSRLALVESFNIQLAQAQIDMREVLKKLMKDSQQPQDQSNLNQVVLDLVKTVEQIKASQNILMIRLKSMT
jgi:Mg2+ and Co2+ transporter CorA